MFEPGDVRWPISLTPISTGPGSPGLGRGTGILSLESSAMRSTCEIVKKSMP